MIHLWLRPLWTPCIYYWHDANFGTLVARYSYVVLPKP